MNEQQPDSINEINEDPKDDSLRTAFLKRAQQLEKQDEYEVVHHDSMYDPLDSRYLKGKTANIDGKEVPLETYLNYF